jgi:hypothetical protein
VTDRPDFLALLEHPDRIGEVPAAEVPALLALLASEQARLAALQGALAARLAVPPAPANGRHGDDLLTDADEVARIVRRSVSWLRKNGHTLPGFCQPGGKGTKVAWSRAALETWASSLRL